MARMPVEPLTAFRSIDLRVGRVLRAERHEHARDPAWKLWIDFGAPIGERCSSAQLTERYPTADLLEGRLVVAAVNLGPRRVAGFVSDVLVLGVPDDASRIVLIAPEEDVPPGGRVH
jgi:tRNA-binding protein